MGTYTGGMRIAFFGSGAFGLPTLEALHEAHEVVLVVTQPDRPAGRKRQLTATPIGQWAAEHRIETRKLEDVNTEAFVDDVASFHLDASVVIAFGQKLSPELIGAMGELAVNLHGSLLPGYRGAAPVQRAVMDGCIKTGVSVIGLAQRMDAGEVYATAGLVIEPTDTSGDVHDKLSALGPGVVGGVLDALEAGSLSPQAQDEGAATRAPKLKKADGTVDFAADGLSATSCRAWINGLNPWPGCRVRWVRQGDEECEAKALILRRVVDETGEDSLGSGELGVVLDGMRVATAGGVIRLLELQAPGTKVMDAAAFSAGKGLKAGDRLLPWADPG